MQRFIKKVDDKLLETIASMEKTEGEPITAPKNLVGRRGTPIARKLREIGLYQ